MDLCNLSVVALSDICLFAISTSSFRNPFIRAHKVADSVSPPLYFDIDMPYECHILQTILSNDASKKLRLSGILNISTFGFFFTIFLKIS